MLKKFQTLFRAQPAAPHPEIPAGTRVYAVGDIHGRSDLFAQVIVAIEEDDSRRGPAETTVVLLGDLVDRGPDSAGVIALARDWAQRRRVRMIAGNHEEMFLAAFHKRDTLRHFLRYGGKETVFSYPVDREAWTAASLEEAQEMMARVVPQADRDFLAGFEDMVRIGDYLFVHAGIDPTAPLDEQRTGDLRWIREPFLSHPGDHGAVVVHGHTISEDPQVRPNRIGIDTGAYHSGRLTVLGLEGAGRWLFEVAGLTEAELAEAKLVKSAG